MERLSCQVLATLLLVVGVNASVFGKHKDAPIAMSCSADQARANINELNDNNSGPFFDFIEIKILQDGTDISGWELCVANDGKEQACATLGAGNGYWGDATSPHNPPAQPDDQSQSNNTVFAANTWITYAEKDNNKLRADANRGEVILLDASGNVIDYIAYDSAGKSCSGSRNSWDQDRWDVPVPPAVNVCGVCFDGKDSNNKNLSRTEPDGTGDWSDSNRDPTTGEDNAVPGSGGADHYAISHDGTAVSCQAEQITVTAHDAAEQAVDPGSVSIALTTSTGRGQWSRVVSGSGTLSGNSGFNGQASYQFPGNGESAVTLALNYPLLVSDPELVNIDLSDGTVGESASEDPDLAVALTGFLFNTITTQIAAKDSDQGWNASLIEIQAVRASDSDPSVCEALFDGSVAIELGVECTNPTSCTQSLQAGVDDGTLATAASPSTLIATNNDDGGPTTSAYSSLTLSFSNPGARAYLAINYPDAGELQLFARRELLDDNGLPSGSYVQGASNRFVVRPFGLGFTNVDDGSGSPNPGGEAPNGAPFITAGDNFQFDLTAYAYAVGEDLDSDGVPDSGSDITDNGVTANFAAATSLSLNAITPVGGTNGTLSAGSLALAGGTAVDQVASYNEVGSVDLLASVTDYLGASDADIVGSSGPIGRFYPAEWALLSGAQVNGSCNNATYMSEPALTLDITLEARNSAGVITQHYDQALMGGSSNLAQVDLHATNGGDATDYGARLSGVGGSWINGRYAISTASASFDRIAAPDGPYDSLQLSVSATHTLPELVQLAGAAGSPASLAVGSPTSIRYGRIAAENAYGPETESLSQPLRAQYYSGSGFVLDSLNDCTEIPYAAVSMNAASYAVGSSVALVDGSGNSLPSFAFPAVSGTAFQLVGGDAGLSYSAPGAGNTGTITLDIDLGALPWLQFDWDDDGSADSTMRPATVTFGRYRGNDRVIFWQENFTR